MENNPFSFINTVISLTHNPLDDCGLVSEKHGSALANSDDSIDWWGISRFFGVPYSEMVLILGTEVFAIIQCPSVTLYPRLSLQHFRLRRDLVSDDTSTPLPPISGRSIMPNK